MRKLWVGLIILIVLLMSVGVWYLSSQEKFKIIHYDKTLNFSASPIAGFSSMPSFSENYWISYNNKTVVYVSKYVFNSSDAPTNFSTQILNLFGGQIKTMENYSFGNYNGHHISDGEKSSFLLVKDNILLAFGGEYQSATEAVMKWFVGKFG